MVIVGAVQHQCTGLVKEYGWEGEAPWDLVMEQLNLEYEWRSELHGTWITDCSASGYETLQERNPGME